MDRVSLPYSSVSIDTNFSKIFEAVVQSFTAKEKDVAKIEENLCQLWTTPNNSNPVLPCLSVRTGFDLFLQSQAYTPGSEIILSAVNLQDMAKVARHHKLKVVTVDIDIDTLEPKMKVLEKLITPKTVAILVAHLYGRRADMSPVISLAKKYDLHVIEDCAECFSGFSYVGHPESDIVLFSFGAIKFATSFSGGIVKVRDQAVHQKMREIHSLYPLQSKYLYLKKVLKYGLMYSVLHVWPFPEVLENLRQSGYDFKELFISYIRGFPSDLILNIRQRPCPALLSVMLLRQANFDKAEFDLQGIKGEYFLNGLTEEMWPVGTDVKHNSFWLFPVIVENPEEVMRSLGAMGLDAYRGTTQLRTIEPDDPDKPIGPNRLAGQMVSGKDRYPHEAKYLMDNVIYLPINKHVPFSALDKMMQICSSAMLNLTSNGASSESAKDHQYVRSKTKSKL